MSEVDKHRIHQVRPGTAGRGPVVCWISREQRLDDNWALLYASELAEDAKVPLVAAFCLADRFSGAGYRQFAFMLAGLRQLEAACRSASVGYALLRGDPGHEMAAFANSLNAAALVHDFDPLRIKSNWQRDTAAGADCPVWEVDSHNVVPCRHASAKQEFSAATFRRKITPLLDNFLTEFPPLKPTPPWRDHPSPVDWDRILEEHPADRNIPPVNWIIPGESAALAGLREFIEQRLERYPLERNDPNAEGTSRLSPWLHFGHLSPQRAALEVWQADAPIAAREAFIEELVVRRELSDNFCYHMPDSYDSLAGIHRWARATLDEHREDRREYVYTVDEFEDGLTHDPLWNAAQGEMVKLGTMPGYLRMYWAKKILEWSDTPEEAARTAIVLNDRWQLDGRDPNGYVGVLWSVGGLHDRAWSERPVFGKVRYMNYNGCRRKFDVDAYVSRVERLEQGTSTS